MIIIEDVTFDEKQVYYQSNTKFKGEQESTKGEISTPLPFLNTSIEREIPQSQENQVDTSSMAPQAEPQLLTSPKYSVRRNNQPPLLPQGKEVTVMSRVNPKEGNLSKKLEEL